MWHRPARRIGFDKAEFWHTRGGIRPTDPFFSRSSYSHMSVCVYLFVCLHCRCKVMTAFGLFRLVGWHRIVLPSINVRLSMVEWSSLRVFRDLLI